MYKVKIVINGVLREMTINANTAIAVQQIITNMYSDVGRSRNNRYKESVKMILSYGNNYKVKGRPSEIAGELGVIFNIIYEKLGESELRFMVKNALDVVIKENKAEVRKEQIKKKKELEKKLKQDLPEEIANILCSML